MDYQEFLKNKNRTELETGLYYIPELNSNLFQFQADIVQWALRRGRSSIFAGTGLGKSLMELSWAKALIDAGYDRVLILAPLAVSGQLKREAEKFGIPLDNIDVSNYQKIDHFDLSEYDGIVLDESSILKNYEGHFRTRLIEEAKQIPFRLAATATPSPNDYMELGNHAEFLGIMSYTDMLTTFFVHDGSSTQNWRLKGHAQEPFWKWVASWAVMLRSPSDIGYDGSDYNLPKLHQIQHTVEVDYEPNINTGMLFPVQAETMSERLQARRATVEERVNYAVDLINNRGGKWVLWCNLNDESRLAASKISGAIELRGSDLDSKKIKTLEAFSQGEFDVLVTKPSICGHGMNWQHVNQTCFVGLNDSFEQIYQAIRRFWRFGQQNEVYAHFIASEIEGQVVTNIRKKERQAEHMANEMVKQMGDLCSDNISGAIRETEIYQPIEKMEVPSWI